MIWFVCLSLICNLHNYYDIVGCYVISMVRILLNTLRNKQHPSKSRAQYSYCQFRQLKIERHYREFFQLNQGLRVQVFLIHYYYDTNVELVICTTADFDQ